jgi:hypothetical protein
MREMYIVHLLLDCSHGCKQYLLIVQYVLFYSTEYWSVIYLIQDTIHNRKLIGGHRHRSQCRRYPTSYIDICYSDIEDKYVGLKNVIPILEVF